jgi:methionyl aminopeptidase
VTIENESDVEGLRRIGRIVATCLKEMGAALEPGMKTAELDAIGDAFLARHGAESAPRITYDFPGATCISIGDQVAHGIPSGRVIEAGDLVNIDVSACKDGYFADTGGTFEVPPYTPVTRKLCMSTRRALQDAMKEARAGAPLNRIGRAIERRAKKAGFGVIRDLCSHGVGRALHEDPEHIYGYYERRDKRRLREGQVITIEPFLTTGPPNVWEADDGWTLMNAPGKRSAQYEHTMIITRSKPIVVTVAA